MTKPTDLIEYDKHRWIDPLAIREVKLMCPNEGKGHRVLVMRDGTHTAVELASMTLAADYVEWLTSKVNAARAYNASTVVVVDNMSEGVK